MFILFDDVLLAVVDCGPAGTWPVFVPLESFEPVILLANGYDCIRINPLVAFRLVFGRYAVNNVCPLSDEPWA